MFLRLSVPAEPGDLRPEIAAIQDYLGTLPDPTYGGQLQTFGIIGHRAEGRMTIDTEEVPVALAGGETVTLRKPTYGLADLAYGPAAPDLMISPRVAPQMIGLGLLEAIPEADILALEDPDDADGDGISGRANRVWSEADGRAMLGRFGWKAGQPTIREQSASAFSGDIGISTTVLPEGWGECTEAETACRAAPDGRSAEADGGRGPEADDTVLDLVAFYSRNLAVPARRDVDDPQVLRGKQVFHDAGCAACHRPKFVTDRLEDQPEQSFQLIWPYTDLLLHDMGEGLADHRPEARATGTRMAHRAALGHRPDRNRHRQDRASSTTAAPAPSSKPSSGTAARPNPPATPSSPSPRPTATPSSASWSRCDTVANPGPTSRGTASAGPFAGARKRGGEGGNASWTGSQIRLWPPRGRECVRPRGADAAGFRRRPKSGAPPLREECDERWEGRSDRSSRPAREPRPDKPRHCLGRAVRRSARARRRRGVRPGPSAPKSGCGRPADANASALGGRTQPDFVDGRNPAPHRSARNAA